MPQLPHDPETLGWDADTIGELDHRLLRAPSIKLRGVHPGIAGDTVYTVDLRLRRPNSGTGLNAREAHSLEHFLLEGYARLLPTSFIGVGVMGCQTGFYLTLQNEGRRALIEAAFATIMHDILLADAVPYARIDQCGDWQNHDLAAAQTIAREVLAQRMHWQDIK